jgi:phosphonate transport system substrate-binding protein
MLKLFQKNLNNGFIFILVLLLSFSAHADDSDYQPTFSKKKPQLIPEYIVGIHPLHNPQHLMELYAPITDYLNSHIPEARFKLETSRDYADFEKKLYAKHFAFAMPNPYQTLESIKYGYRVFGKMADDHLFTGIILVRKDSDIKKVTDLKGKAVSYPAETALAATLMPQYFLQTHGLDVNHDIENRYVGSQESSIMAVFRGHVAAGATWPIPWQGFMVEHPEMASQLILKWETEPLLNNGWVVRNDIPAPLLDKFARLLFSLHENPQGVEILKRLPLSHFEPATDETYRPVRDFLEKFSKTVRPIKK